MNINLQKLNELFGLKAEICRYCGGNCQVSMQESTRGTYPYSECPECKKNLLHYSGVFFVCQADLICD